MTPVGTNINTSMTPVALSSNVTNTTVDDNAAETAAVRPLEVENNKITLSDEGKALLEALKKLDSEGEASSLTTVKDKPAKSEVSSFVHGALGMQHPNSVKTPEEQEDTSYTAGKYLSMAATVGGILLAIA